MKKNIIANYIGKIWSFGSVYIFIRFYVDILGVESYGIINFYNVLYALIFFLDAGLSATLNREFSRTEDKKYLRNLLFTVEKVFLAIIIFVILITFLLSDIISKQWLTVENLSIEVVSDCIKIMGFSIAIQLFTTLYNSGLIGLEKQVLQNVIQTCGSVFRSALVLLPLYFYPSLYTFFIWQATINLFILLITRYHLWKSIPFDRPPKYDLKILDDIKKFALGMIMMSVIGALNTQIDKLITSKLLTLTEYAYYALCSVLAQAPTLAVIPIFVAILPRLTKHVENKSKIELKKAFHTYSYITSVIIFTLCTILFLFSQFILQFWLNVDSIDNNLILVTRLLIIGGFLLALQFMPYYFGLAHGHNKTNVKLGGLVLVLNIPLTIFFTLKYGVVGPGIPWIIVNLISFVVLSYIVINKFLNKEYYKWLIYDVLLPLLICFAVGIIGYFCANFVNNLIEVIIMSSFLGVLSLVINFLVFTKIKKRLQI